jgi:hypothetical protein
MKASSPPASLNGRYRLVKATFVGIGGKEEDAPKPVICMNAIKLVGSSHCRLKIWTSTGYGCSTGLQPDRRNKAGGTFKPGLPLSAQFL